MATAVSVGESPPAWVIDQLRGADIELRHVDDPRQAPVPQDVIAYVMNSYGLPPAPMTDELAERFSNLRSVIYQGQSREPADYESFVDLGAMRRRGVVVAHTPAGDAVAEAAFGLLIALDLDLVEASSSGSRMPPHRGLSGNVLGILGLGQIGTQVARLAVAAGMRVQYTSRRDHPDAEHDLGLQRVGIEELFKTSQFISVHLPASAPSGTVGTELLSSVRELILINNTSVPQIVEPAALLDSIRSGAVLRAYSEGRYSEPWQQRFDDLGPGRFVSAPAYTSWDTPRARAAGWELTVEALCATCTGDPVPYRLV